MKHSILKTFATLMLTAPQSSFGAVLTNPNFGIAEPIATTEAMATQNPVSIIPIYPLINWGGIKTQQVPTIDPNTNPVVSIKNTEQLTMTLSPEDALAMLNDGGWVETFRYENSTKLTKLFLGQISSSPMKIVNAQLKPVQTKLNYDITNHVVTKSIQIIRMLHALLHKYFPDKAIDLLNSCRVDANVSPIKALYLYAPKEVADLLLDLHARGMYISRNVLYIYNDKREALKSMFDLIQPGTLPGNMAKSPLVIELAHPIPLPKASLPKDSTNKPGADPHKGSSNPGAGKKQFRHNR